MIIPNVQAGNHLFKSNERAKQGNKESMLANEIYNSMKKHFTLVHKLNSLIFFIYLYTTVHLYKNENFKLTNEAVSTHVTVFCFE